MQVSSIFNKLSNSKIIQRHLDKIVVDEILAARILVCSGIAKDAVSYVFRYQKTKNNKEIPEDKRKFVAAMDLVSGMTTCVIQLGLGFAISNRKFQKALCAKLFGYIKNAEKFKEAKEGFIALISLIVSGVIGERILVPLIATPIATKVKENWERKHSQNNLEASPKKNIPLPYAIFETKLETKK